MNPLLLVCFTVLILSSVVIIVQDFKDRKVSLWALIIFGINSIFSVVYFRDIESLILNVLGTFIYLGFILVTLKLYLFLKFKKNKTLINHFLGMADVLIILFIGFTFNTIGMIFFFCAGFLCSLVLFLAYSLLKKNTNAQSIPLAGILVFIYVITVIILNLSTVTNLIDCSFISL